MLQLGLTNQEILFALGENSSMNKTSEIETNRLFLTDYLVMDFVTDDEDRRLEILTELYPKDLKYKPSEDEDNDNDIDIIEAIRVINKKYNFNFPLPKLEYSETEEEPKKFHLNDIRGMLGNDAVFEHLLKYLYSKIIDDQIPKINLLKYAILSDCDDFSLKDRNEFVHEIGEEEDIEELSKKFNLDSYIPKHEINENNMPRALDSEPDIYNLQQIRYMLEPAVFEDFKTMFDHKDKFTIKDLVTFAAESTCDKFYLDDRNSFLEDIGFEGDISDAAKVFDLDIYLPKLHEEVPETKKDISSFYSGGKHKLVTSDITPPKPEKYSSYFKNEEQLLNTGMWLTTKFGDLGNELLAEFHNYCKECRNKNENLYLEFRADQIITNAISMYRFFYYKHPELIFGTYGDDSFWFFFRSSSTPDG